MKRCYNTLKEVGLLSDMNNSHMLSIIERKMCADDRKVWARDLEKEKKPANLVPRVSHLNAWGERGETLVGSGHVSPRIWEMTIYPMKGGAA